MNAQLLHEATIAGVHRAFCAGTLTSREFVAAYRSRIEAYDHNGAGLGAIMTVNPRAYERAEELDFAFAQEGRLRGPLHGIPIVVKDQAVTADMVTTFGSKSFRSYVSPCDAAAVARLREAGAVILAKTSMPDFALLWFSLSSTGVVAKNPYAFDREPGGSSGGTAVAIAANLALAGLGEDTSGSIRVPSSFCNVVGLRATTGLISPAGMSPLIAAQDCPGPMTRTVEDAARVLDVLAAPESGGAGSAVRRPQGRYSACLSPGALIGVRIGVLREMFAPVGDAEAQQASAVWERALGQFEAAGAELIDPVRIPHLDVMLAEALKCVRPSRQALDAFVHQLPSSRVASIEQVEKMTRYGPALSGLAELADSELTPAADIARQRIRKAVVDAMRMRDVSAVVFPDVRIPAPLRSDVLAGRWSTATFPTNTRLASYAGLPALSLPAGFTTGGLPVGIEVVGRPYEEQALLRYGYAFEQLESHRIAPLSTPPLADEP